MSSDIHTPAIAWTVHTFHINTINKSERVSPHVRKGGALPIIGVNIIKHNHNDQHTLDSFVYHGFSVCIMDAYSHFGISKVCYATLKMSSSYESVFATLCHR